MYGSFAPQIPQVNPAIVQAAAQSAVHPVAQLDPNSLNQAYQFANSQVTAGFMQMAQMYQQQALEGMRVHGELDVAKMNNETRLGIEQIQANAGMYNTMLKAWSDAASAANVANITGQYDVQKGQVAAQAGIQEAGMHAAGSLAQTALQQGRGAADAMAMGATMFPQAQLDVANNYKAAVQTFGNDPLPLIQSIMGKNTAEAYRDQMQGNLVSTQAQAIPYELAMKMQTGAAAGTQAALKMMMQGIVNPQVETLRNQMLSNASFELGASNHLMGSLISSNPDLQQALQYQHQTDPQWQRAIGSAWQGLQGIATYLVPASHAMTPGHTGVTDMLFGVGGANDTRIQTIQANAPAIWAKNSQQIQQMEGFQDVTTPQQFADRLSQGFNGLVPNYNSPAYNVLQQLAGSDATSAQTLNQLNGIQKNMSQGAIGAGLGLVAGLCAPTVGRAIGAGALFDSVSSKISTTIDAAAGIQARSFPTFALKTMGIALGGNPNPWAVGTGLLGRVAADDPAIVNISKQCSCASPSGPVPTQGFSVQSPFAGTGGTQPNNFVGSPGPAVTNPFGPSQPVPGAYGAGTGANLTNVPSTPPMGGAPNVPSAPPMGGAPNVPSAPPPGMPGGTVNLNGITPPGMPGGTVNLNGITPPGIPGGTSPGIPGGISPGISGGATNIPGFVNPETKLILPGMPGRGDTNIPGLANPTTNLPSPGIPGGATNMNSLPVPGPAPGPWEQAMQNHPLSPQPTVQMPEQYNAPTIWQNATIQPSGSNHPYKWTGENWVLRGDPNATPLVAPRTQALSGPMPSYSQMKTVPGSLPGGMPLVQPQPIQSVMPPSLPSLPRNPMTPSLNSPIPATPTMPMPSIFQGATDAEKAQAGLRGVKASGLYNNPVFKELQNVDPNLQKVLPQYLKGKSPNDVSMILQHIQTMSPKEQQALAGQLNVS